MNTYEKLVELASNPIQTHLKINGENETAINTTKNILDTLKQDFQTTVDFRQACEIAVYA